MRPGVMRWPSLLSFSGADRKDVGVVKAGQALTLEALQAHCRRKLAGFKVPKQLIVAPICATRPARF
jgi:2'-5' RNA ligase